MPASTARRFVVVFRGELGHCAAQLVSELGMISGGREPELGVDRQRGQWLFRQFGLACEFGDVSDHASGDRDQVSGREAIRPAWIGAVVAQRGGRHDVTPCRGYDDAFFQTATRSLLDELDEAVRLQRPQMLVDILARDS